MAQSRSRPLHIQLVQMVGAIMLTYNPLAAHSGACRICPCRGVFMICLLSPDRIGAARYRIDPIGSFAPSGAVLVQSGVEAVDQSLSGEGLGQETGRSSFQGPRANVLDRESRDENERHPVSPGKQVGLQFETVHHWHLNICYHTRGGIQVRRAQELLGRCECMNDVSK